MKKSHSKVGTLKIELATAHNILASDIITVKKDATEGLAEVYANEYKHICFALGTHFYKPLKQDTTTTVLCDLLEWAKGNRGSKSGNPYCVPEVKAALEHLAKLQGITNYLDAKTDLKGGS